MSNDEYNTSLVNYNNNRYYIGPTTITNYNYYYNNINNNNNIYETVFLPAKHTNDKSPTLSSSQKSTFNQTDDEGHRLVIDKHFKPMNLITNAGLDLSHSIRKPYTSTSSTTYYNNESLNLSNSSHTNNDSYVLSPSLSSSSSSIDVENDDNDKVNSIDQIMPPVSIPTHHQQKSFITDTRNPSQSTFTNMELTAGSIPSSFPLNYQQLYANNAALYGAPVMFSGAIHAAHASYMTGLPLHAALSPNETYLKAIQAAACGIYSPPSLAPPSPAAPPTAPPSVLNCKSIPGLHNNPSSNIIAPTSSSSSAPSISVGISKSSRHQQYSSNMINNNSSSSSSSNSSNAKAEQQKTNYQATPLNSHTRLSGNNNGTYLNDKVNERLSGVNAVKDSHFKVPNGKEGSLKHRILRPPSNSDSTTEPNKTPVMRTYSTTSSFKKGNYIELANGALRRVEDMRTEDFIQCAERSPHHQLAESTVVKINTSLPSTAVITFSYDRNNSKVDMEVSLDHPFFVYGQGWASCSPEMSMKIFGLKCQRLQVGDICISLIKREQPPQSTSPTSHPYQINDAINCQRRHSITVPSPNVNLKSPPSLPSTEMPSYAHAFTMHVPQPTNHHLQQQQAYVEMAKLMSSYAYAKGLPQIPHEQIKEVVLDSAFMQNLPSKMMNAFYQNQIFQFAHQKQQQQQQHSEQTELTQNSHQQCTSAISTAHFSHQPTDLEHNHYQQHQHPPQTQPLDVTMSRKRRWSAPENMFDDDEADTQPPRNRLSPATARS